MPYMGILERVSPLVITMECPACAVAVVQVNERGGVHETVYVTGNLGTHEIAFDEVVGARVVRLRLALAPTINVTGRVTMDNGGRRVLDSVDVIGDIEFTFRMI